MSRPNGERARPEPLSAEAESARGGESYMLSAGERELVLRGWNDTAVDVPAGTLADLFAAQAVRAPGAAAVIDGGEQLSYAGLDERSSQLARYLIGPEAVVTIALPRGCLPVTAVLAVAKKGAAYLPADPVYPAERTGFMLADAGAVLVVTDAATRLAARQSAAAAHILSRRLAMWVSSNLGQTSPVSASIS